VTLNQHKYVTFKREDFERLMSKRASPLTLQIAEIPDAVVIRQQDIFAASAFYAYANHLRGVVEVMKEVGFDDPEWEEHLHEIADYFMDMGGKSSTMDSRKVPD